MAKLTLMKIRTVDGESLVKRAHPTKKRQYKMMPKFSWTYSKVDVTDILKENEEYKNAIMRKHQAHQRRVTKKKVVST